MNCECYQRINAGLKEKNLRLRGHGNRTPAFEMGPAIETEWIDTTLSAGRAPIPFFGSHCPFCGTSYEPPIPETVLTTDAKPGDPIVWVNLDNYLETIEGHVKRLQQMTPRLVDSEVSDALEVVADALDEVHNAITEINSKLSDYLCANGKTLPVIPKAEAENPKPGPPASSTSG